MFGPQNTSFTSVNADIAILWYVQKHIHYSWFSTPGYENYRTERIDANN